MTHDNPRYVKFEDWDGRGIETPRIESTREKHARWLRAPSEPTVECCPECNGVLEHVLGCPEQDKAR